MQRRLELREGDARLGLGQFAPQGLMAGQQGLTVAANLGLLNATEN
jgi:hypothetical protein